MEVPSVRGKGRSGKGVRGRSWCPAGKDSRGTPSPERGGEQDPRLSEGPGPWGRRDDRRMQTGAPGGEAETASSPPHLLFLLRILRGDPVLRREGWVFRVESTAFGARNQVSPWRWKFPPCGSGEGRKSHHCL